MNIDQAKQLDLADVLARLGFEPSFRRKEQLWYLSPFRNERTHAFVQNQRCQNLWYDFGKGIGGDVIDLVTRLERLSSVSEALGRLRKLLGTAPRVLSIPTSIRKASEQPALELERIGPIRSHRLVGYLKLRGITPARVAGELHEAQYRCGEERHRALAFANDSGGYELRTPTFKGTLAPKNMTTIIGDSSRVAVFEGFFDYLTALMMHGKRLDATVLVLNSVSFRGRALAAIQQLGAKTVDVYRDHDAAGDSLLSYFRESLPHAEILDKASLYA